MAAVRAAAPADVTIRAIPGPRDAKNAYLCETPRSRGRARTTGSGSATTPFLPKRHWRNVEGARGRECRVRLNAYLARAGVASRRGADELIKAGRVSVNGGPGELNTFVESGDRVEVDGRAVSAQQLAYVLLHKPA